MAQVRKDLNPPHRDYRKDNMNLQEAIDYINYGIKEGFFDEDTFINMSDEDKIKFANEQSGRAEMAYNALKDEEKI